MDKADLGLKFTCVNCAARAFDLKRSPAICPKCGTEQPVARRRPPPIPRGGSRSWATTKAPAARRDPEDADAVVADEAEEDVDEDADTIDPDALEDDDDVEVIVPVVED